MKKLLLGFIFVGILMPSMTIASTAPAASDPQRFTFEFITDPFSWGNFFSKIGLAAITAAISGYAIKYAMELSSYKPKPIRTQTKLESILGKKPKEFEDIVDMIDNPITYFNLGVKFPKAMLFEGPPGTGKTEIARGLANKLGATYYEICGSEFISKWTGEASKNIQALFAAAKNAAYANNSQGIKSVIFIDELETIAPSRTGGITQHHDNQVVGTLLTEMTSIENQGILILGATNHKSMIDHAMLRPGRFDSTIAFGLPRLNDRELILQHHAKPHFKYLEDWWNDTLLLAMGAKQQLSRGYLKRTPDLLKRRWVWAFDKENYNKINFRALAQKTKNFSGAHLKELCNKAARCGARSRRSFLIQEDFEQGLSLMIQDQKGDKIHMEMHA